MGGWVGNTFLTSHFFDLADTFSSEKGKTSVFWPKAPDLFWAWPALGKARPTAVDFLVFINDMLATIARGGKMKIEIRRLIICIPISISRLIGRRRSPLNISLTSTGEYWRYSLDS